MASETKDLTVQVPTTTGIATVALRINTGPTALVELVALANVLTNIMSEAATAAAQGEGKAVSCRAGCGACCRQLVSLSIPEALHVAEIVAESDATDGGVTRSRFDEAKARIEEHDLTDALVDPTMEDGAFPVVIDYFRRGIPCPFLVDERCSIHARRPVRCREYSVTSPADRCVDPYRYGVDVIPMPPSLTIALARLTAELTGEEARLVPLPLAPSWAAEHAELAARTWPGFELVTRFLAMLG